MTAAGQKIGLRDGMNGSQLEPAGRGRMPEGRDLRRLDACGELIGSGTGGDFGFCAGGADDGVWGVVAAGEQTGEEACKAEGSYFEEATFGSRGGEEVHELRSRWCIDAERLVVSVAGGIWSDNDTFGGVVF